MITFQGLAVTFRFLKILFSYLYKGFCIILYSNIIHITFLANREIEQNEGSTTICIQYNLRDKQNFSMFSSL